MKADAYLFGQVLGTHSFLLRGMEDEALVRFASACSGVAISRFHLPLHPPTLADVHALMDNAK